MILFRETKDEKVKKILSGGKKIFIKELIKSKKDYYKKKITIQQCNEVNLEHDKFCNLKKKCKHENLNLELVVNLNEINDASLVCDAFNSCYVNTIDN